MQAYPHRYSAQASATVTGSVALAAEGLPTLSTASPPQFGGPGGQWSPETLLVGAAADCFILTFRSVAAASGLAWTKLECAADGALDQVDGVVRFTGLRLEARLVVTAGNDPERARRLLEKAERVCLIANSLNCERSLRAEVTVG